MVAAIGTQAQPQYLVLNNPQVDMSKFKVDKEGFELDGDNAKLMNLYVETSGADELIDDPHYCCTSCGGPAKAHIPMGDDLGLIRSIITTSGTATVKNVNLNDVLIKVEKKVKAITDKEAINNIGSIVGNVSITGDFTFTDNALGEVKIIGNGEKVGGMIGSLVADGGKLTIEGNTSKSTKKTGGYVKSDFDYVGGLIGYAEGAAVKLNNNLVKMQDNVEAGKGYAAGMIGSLKSTDILRASNNEVEIQEITAVESYAAGLVGNLDIAKSAIFSKSKVTAMNISTGDMYAGGLIGQAQTGTSNLALRDSKVKVTTELAAENGQVGGLLGNIKKAGTVKINQDDITADHATTVELAKLTGAYAAGGILGSSDSGIKFILYTGHTTGTGAKTNSVTVKVTDYFNPKSATYYTGSDAYKYGTMQSIIGFKQGDVTIFTDKLTAENNLTDAKKKAVFYQAHPDAHHTTQPGEYYWGDTNNYVGFGDTGKYYLNASANFDTSANELQLSEQEDGYNYFKAY